MVTALFSPFSFVNSYLSKQQVAILQLERVSDSRKIQIANNMWLKDAGLRRHYI